MEGPLEQVSFPHLTDFECEALERLSAVSGQSFVVTLLRSASPDEQRTAIHEFLTREHATATQCASTPARSDKKEIVKIDTSQYSGVGQDRLPLNRWFREIAIAMDARQLASDSARVHSLLSHLSGKAKEWALGKLVVDDNAFPSLASLEKDLRLAFEPPQDESRRRAAFFALKHGKTSMRDYVQKARHLVSCIAVNPIDMATQVHVYIFGMRESMTRYCLVRAEPKTLEQAFALALREDYTVASSYTKPMSAEARVSAPEPMEIDAVEASASDNPRGFQSFRGGRGGRGGRGQGPLTCFRCQKQRHRAAVCRAPAPVLANIEAADMSGASKKRRRPVGAGLPTGMSRDLGTVAARSPDAPVLHAQFNATTSSGDSRLIIVSLHVAGARRPLRALLDSGATNNFLRASCLPELPADCSAALCFAVV